MIPDFSAQLTAAFAEDLAGGVDVTSEATIPADARLQAVMVAREPLVLAGLPVAVGAFGGGVVGVGVEEGSLVGPGTVLLTVEGPARALLSAERTALNFVQHLSGIATLTRRYVDAIAGTGATLLDTRKTTPGLRALEKYAVRMGGGSNHRMGLNDAILIKDNHIAVAGGVFEAVRRAKTASALPVEVEVDRLDQIEPALSAGADRLLLDNMDAETLKQAVKIVNRRVPTEASGGVRLETIRKIAESGVDFISVGRLTQGATAVDIGLDYGG